MVKNLLYGTAANLYCTLCLLMKTKLQTMLSVLQNCYSRSWEFTFKMQGLIPENTNNVIKKLIQLATSLCYLQVHDLSEGHILTNDRDGDQIKVTGQSELRVVWGLVSGSTNV